MTLGAASGGEGEATREKGTKKSARERRVTNESSESHSNAGTFHPRLVSATILSSLASSSSSSHSSSRLFSSPCIHSGKLYGPITFECTSGEKIMNSRTTFSHGDAAEGGGPNYLWNKGEWREARGAATLDRSA